MALFIFAFPYFIHGDSVAYFLLGNRVRRASIPGRGPIVGSSLVLTVYYRFTVLLWCGNMRL
jgi:hypothetical protein